MGNDKITLCDRPHLPEKISLFSPQLIAQSRTAPRLSAYMSYVNFGSVPVYSTRSQFVTFMNEGDRTLHLRNLQSSNTAFQLSNNSFSIPPGDSVTLRITFSPYFNQTYSGSISFTTNDAQHSSASIYVTGSGTAQ